MAAKRSHLEIPLSEMQRSYENQLAGLDSIKTTMRTIFGSASLIVSLIGALQVFTSPISPEWMGLYQTMLIAISVLYLALIVVCIRGMWPVYINPPLPFDWDTLSITFKDMDEKKMIAQHLSQVLQAIDLNRPIVKRFYRFEITALTIFPVLVLLILLLAWLPRV